MALTLNDRTRTRYWIGHALGLDACTDQSWVSELTRQINSEIEFIGDDASRDEFRIVLLSVRRLLVARLADMNDINYVYPTPDLEFLRQTRSLVE